MLCRTPKIEGFSTNENLSKYTCASYYYNKTQDMKTIITLIFVLFIGVAAQAQNNTKEVKAETIEMTIVNLTSIEKVTFENATLENKTEVARLYKFKNSKIKKALSFTTKRNKAKMA